jgi:Xaa-Pro aminopeptidase
MNSIPRHLARQGLAAEVAVPTTLLGRRATRARELMRAEGLDALVVPSRGHITQYGDVEFLAGYTPVARMAYAVLPRDAVRPVLVVPTPADRWYASRLPDPPQVRVAGQGDLLSGADDLAGTAASVLVEARLDAGRVGIAGLRSLLPVGEFDALRRALPGAELVDAGALMSRLKLLKDDEELARRSGAPSRSPTPVSWPHARRCGRARPMRRSAPRSARPSSPAVHATRSSS